jgi:hypothetical protein
MRGIRITIKVMVFLLTGGWFDQAHHKWFDFAHHEEKGQRMQRIHRERIKRICWVQILTLQLKKGVQTGF